ncbi:outer membrane lipoprotein chaperone LolA [Fangia hongkongensis]|uniref:outer membrane lipoprotein chaperone LolA n=1 Tax=Fangia hongkongensis TaxID=270495 RepID=UPI0003636065|nr:outer membrane lipoprotein chaperone LolA [Fangia hongkongensis]MBK2125710.1 outer membrane lipoprotein chaperone LolA [Fangia hongkongensis]
MKRLFVKVCYYTLTLFLVSLSYAQSENGVKSHAQTENKAAQALFAKISALDNMHADFTQVLRDTNQGQLQKSTGQIWIKKPSYFKWQILSPNKQLLVSNGKKLWNYDEDLEQVTVQSVPTDVSQAPYLLLLSGNESVLTKVFSVSALSEDSYRLKPKDGTNSLIQYVDMRFSGKKLTELVIQSETAQSTVITFDNVSFQPISKHTFYFTAPKGVDILGA